MSLITRLINRPDVKRLPRFWFCLVMAFFFTLQPAATPAADTSQAILQDTLTALWTGRDVGDQALKAMLNSGAVSGPELASMIETAMPSILDSQQTSRYILKTLPDRVDTLFAPHLGWQDFRKILWRTMTAPADRNNPLLLRVGTLAPPGTPWLSVPENIIFPEINKLSDGKVLFKIYGGGVMGEDTDVLEKMKAAELESCGCTALGVLEASPEAAILMLPFLFNNYEEIDFVCDKFRKRLDEGFEKNGYIMVALIDTGFFYLFSRNKIAGLDDIRKQNVITWFGLVETTLYQELGISPTPVAVPDTVSALSTGLADINAAPAAWMLGMQAFQYSNFYFKPPLVYSPAAVIISAGTIKKLQQQFGVSATFAKNIQEMMVVEFNTYEPEWKRQVRIYEEKSLKAFETKCGMKPLPFPPEDLKTMEKAAEAVQQKLAGKLFPKDFLNDVQKALKEYRATH